MQCGGADDFFSSDFSHDELQERLGHVGNTPSLRRCLVAFSGKDEYVPSTVDSRKLTNEQIPVELLALLLVFKSCPVPKGSTGGNRCSSDYRNE